MLYKRILLLCTIFCVYYALGDAGRTVQSGTHSHHFKAYETGDSVSIECRNHTNQWGPAPLCVETNRPMSFQFGLDSFQHCGIKITDNALFEYFRTVITREAEWSCRVKMVQDHDLYLPFSIPLWGVSEPDHMHIDTHLNFIFHAENGKIIGAAAYPVRDRFQLTVPGTMLNLHGPVVWFHSHSFLSFSNAVGPIASSDGCFFLVLQWCALSAVFTAMLTAFIYQTFVRPKLLRKFIKQD